MFLFVSVYSLEATKSAILPELVELTNDEESVVRIAGLQTVVNILTLVDEGKPFEGFCISNFIKTGNIHSTNYPSCLIY